MIVSYKWRFIYIRTHKTASKNMEALLATCCGDRDIISPRGPITPNSPARNYKGLFNPIADILFESVNARTVIRRFREQMRFYNHMTAGQIKRRIGSETWNEFFKFCFERNPWDKVVSHYWYRKANPRKRPVGSFEEYLESCRCPVDHPLYTIGGELAVDEVGRFENLESDFRRITERIGLPQQKLPRRSNTQFRTSSRSYEDYYNDRTRRLVADLYAKEIEMFGYRFDGG